METFDAIVSLGGFCGAAMQLRARGLRPYALPFDWTVMDSPDTIKYLARAFKDGFDDFCLEENLTDLAWQGEAGVTKYKYRDRVSGYGFVHHFHKSLADGGWSPAHAVMMRRIDRLLRLFENGGRILLILATPFEYDPALAENLLYALRGKYPQTAFELQVMQYGVAFDDPDVLASRWPTSRPFFGGGRYARETCIYDLSWTSHEWSFLDDLSLASSVGKMHGGVKLVYRLWKSLSKYLTNKGHGCIGIRFSR